MTDLDDDELFAEVIAALPQPKNVLQELIRSFEFLERLRIKIGEPYDIPDDLLEDDDERYHEIFGEYLTHPELSGFARLVMIDLLHYLPAKTIQAIGGQQRAPWELDDREQKIIDAAMELKVEKNLDLINLGHALEKDESLGWQFSRRKDNSGTTGKRHLSRIGKKIKEALWRPDLPIEARKTYEEYIKVLFPKLKNSLDRREAARKS